MPAIIPFGDSNSRPKPDISVRQFFMTSPLAGLLVADIRTKFIRLVLLPVYLAARSARSIFKDSFHYLIILTALSGCKQFSGTVTNECVWAKPIRPSADDVLTSGTVTQLLIHNSKGADICGWKP